MALKALFLNCTLKPSPAASNAEAFIDRHLFTNKMMYYMVHNMVHLAKTLRDSPYPTNVNELTERARQISD